MQQIVADNGGDKILKGDKNPDGSYKYFPGDFRSSECVEFLQQADIVITNPPFSLFREYVAQLFAYKKKFLIIGNMNAITYKEIFPKIKENEMWLGNFSGAMLYEIPKKNSDENSRKNVVKIHGKKFAKMGNTTWYTNLQHGKRHEKLQLMTMADNLKFNKKIQKSATAYKKYDNYDAIEVPFTDAIPSDFGGVMGVPISFLDKYNPEQFEILGVTQRNDDPYKIKKYQLSEYKNANDLNARSVIILDNGIPKAMYARILLKFRESPANSTKSSDNSEAKNSDDGENHF